VFLPEYINDKNTTKSDFSRIVIGGGALGLFIASCISKEFSNSNLTILTKSKIKQPVLVQDLTHNISQFHFQNIVLSKNFKNTSIKLPQSTPFAILYICIPPDLIKKSYQYISKIINYNYHIKKFFIIFLNNGIVDHNIIKIFNKKTLVFIRCIVLSGFLREIKDNSTIIINTSGKNVYYGSSAKISKPHLSKILPMEYLKFNYKKNIFNIEKAKFITNFLLGLCIGKKILPNSEIFKILPKEQRKIVFKNFCLLFPGTSITPLFIEKYFTETIKNTAENFNSISVSWHNGNSKTINYFVANIKKMSYSINKREVILFFNRFIKKFQPN
jgi:hypothetical protein